MELSLLQGLALWLVPAILFVAYASYVVVTGKLCFENNKADNWAVFPCIVALILPLLGVAYAYFVLGYPVSLGGIAGYTVFEFVGSWIVFGMFYCSSVMGSFEFFEMNRRQKVEFNLDIDTLDVGAFILRQVNDDLYRKESWSHGVRPVLYRVRIGRDLSGDHKYLYREHTFPFGLKTEYTREKLTETLKGYFDNEKVFTLDAQAILVDVESKSPEILVIR